MSRTQTLRRNYLPKPAKSADGAGSHRSVDAVAGGNRLRVKARFMSASGQPSNPERLVRKGRDMVSMESVPHRLWRRMFQNQQKDFDR